MNYLYIAIYCLLVVGFSTQIVLRGVSGYNWPYEGHRSLSDLSELQHFARVSSLWWVMLLCGLLVASFLCLGRCMESNSLCVACVIRRPHDVWRLLGAIATQQVSLIRLCCSCCLQGCLMHAHWMCFMFYSLFALSMPILRCPFCRTNIEKRTKFFFSSDGDGATA